MDKIIVVYWSQTGNTQTMAETIGEGIRAAGKEAEVLEISEVSMDALKEAKAFALGCPAMGSEVLEETEMEPFVAEVEQFAEGKTLGLFGSFGWGDGEWMRDWADRMREAGAQVADQDCVITLEAPDEDALAKCRALGQKLAAI